MITIDKINNVFLLYIYSFGKIFQYDISNKCDTTEISVVLCLDYVKGANIEG